MNPIAKQVKDRFTTEDQCGRNVVPKRPATRWQQANLFRNPFGELEREERAKLAVADVTQILDAIAAQDHDGDTRFCEQTAFQLLGECGRGKTSRLLAIQHRFPQSVYVYLGEDQPCPTVPWGWPLLIDEAQRLPRRVRRLIFSSKVPLVLATHRDLTRSLRRAGYRVTSERIGLTLSAEKLKSILNQRINASRRDESSQPPQVTTAIANKLISRFGTDVRAIEGFLYEVVQQQVDTDGQMRFID